MYCKFCGSVIPDDSVFCHHCGNKQDGTPVPEQMRVSRPAQVIGTSPRAASSLISFPASEKWKNLMFVQFGLWVVCAILLFCNWFTINIPFLGSMSMSFFSLNSTVRELDDLGYSLGSSGNLFSLGTIVFLIIFVLLLVLTIILFRSKNRRMFTSSIALSLLLIALPVFLLIFCNSRITPGDELEELFVDSLFEVSAVPYILIVVAVAAVITALIARNEYKLASAGSHTTSKHHAHNPNPDVKSGTKTSAKSGVKSSTKSGVKPAAKSGTKPVVKSSQKPEKEAIILLIAMIILTVLIIVFAK